MVKQVLYLGLFLCTVTSCSTKLYYNSTAELNNELNEREAKPFHTVYLLGDAGSPDLKKREPNLRLLQSLLEKDSSSSLLVLGDNIYYNGLPPEGHPTREISEKKIIEQMKTVTNHNGNVFFIPGNHDWDYMKEEGLKRVKLQEEFVETFLNKGNTWIPDNGCPGPHLVELSENLVFIAFDSQWWFHKHQKPYGPNSGCDAGDEKAFLRRMEQLVEANKHKNIIVGAHHPFVSNSNHGGYFSVMDHIFPLRLVYDNLYVPLPVIGSMYPFFRKYGGTEQDIPHPRSQELINELLKIYNKYDNIIVATGHDHNLQMHRLEKIIHILSGSGCKTNPVKAGDGAEFVVREKGFVRLLYYPDSEVWAEFWSPVGEGDSGKVWYRTKLYTRSFLGDEQNCAINAPSFTDSIVVTTPAEINEPGRRAKRWIGENYSSEWNMSIPVPVLDVRNYEGGLIPYSIGGHYFRTGLRFKSANDKEFLATPVQRHPYKLLPTEMYDHRTVKTRNRTRISFQHPYAPAIVPSIHDKINNRTNIPTLVIIPEANCLKRFNQQFANKMVFLEQRAETYHTEELQDGERFLVLEYEQMIAEVESNISKVFDEKDFAGVRLIDMLVGDWDRTADKYHWAEVSEGDKVTFKTVATDYENAFFSANGILAKILSSRLFIRSWENFHGNINDIKGLNNSARHIDRRLLQSITKKEWEEIAVDLQAILADTVLENALKIMPSEIYKINGDRLLQLLKLRRDNLVTTALEYYKILAAYVDVYGSAFNDHFQIEVINPQQVKIEITTRDTTSGNTVVSFSRIISSEETKEIRLYGLEGKNTFTLNGRLDKNLKVRIIPGVEQASITDVNRQLIVYQQQSKYAAVDKIETNQDFVPYNIEKYKLIDNFFYNNFVPVGYVNYNSSDGLTLGAGFTFRRYKFRQNPYGGEHRFLYQKLINNITGRLYYRGDNKAFYKNFDLLNEGWFYFPGYEMEYRGFGNETPKESYKKIEVQNLSFSSMLYKSFGTFYRWGIGPRFEAVYNHSRDMNDLQNIHKLDSSRFQQYLGLRGLFQFGIKDNYKNPTRGLMVRMESHFNQHLTNTSHYSKSQYEVAYFMSPDLPFQFTVAGRLAGAFNTGNYSFFQGNMLSGGLTPEFTQNLRGYGKTRFIGDRSLVYNIELRSELFNYRIAPFPAKFGVITLKDAGRVWVKNEKSNKWHHSYGGGIWISAMNRFVVSTSVARSVEGTYFYINNGFLF